jgi:hypothetical protein
MFLFTCLVLLTDGISGETAYFVFALLLLLIPALNVAVISFTGIKNRFPRFYMKKRIPGEQRETDNPYSMGAIMRIAAVILNIVLLGFTCWAFIDQYPHPREGGFILYAVLVVLIPVFTMVTIFPYGIMKRAAA